MRGRACDPAAEAQLFRIDQVPDGSYSIFQGKRYTATIKAAGAAVISYDPMVVGREGTPRNNKQGAFYSIYGASSSTGLLAAWGWGVSRIIDVVEQSGNGILKADAMGVTGCSRYGKGAFAIGVFDQRIALTMPIESGSAGVPIFRGIPGQGAAYNGAIAPGQSTEFGFQGTGTGAGTTPTCSAA